MQTKALFGILTTTAALAMQVHAQSYPTNGLVAYYRLNGNANDATGSGNNGIASNVIFSTNRFGAPLSAAYFSGLKGTNSAIDCPTLNNLSYYPLSYSCWFLLASNLVQITDYPSSGSAFMTLVGREQSDKANNDGAFCLVSGESAIKVTNFLSYAYAKNVCYPGTFRPQTNTWYHGVIAIDTNGVIRLYINGGLSGTNAVGTANLAGIGPLPFRIGGSTYYYSTGNSINPRYSWRGAIDDVRIYNRALSADEVVQLYQYESQPPTPYAATATATVINGFVVGATVTDGGYGYTNTPSVLITGGGGNGATATAVVSSGMVIAINFLYAGYGYTNTPSIIVAPPQLLGSPHPATATAILVNDFVVGATITDGGYGYTNTPAVKISGGGGSGAQAVAVVSNGVVVAVNILDAGYGYTSPPLIVVEPPFIPQPTMGIAAMSLLSFTNLTVGINYQLQCALGNTWSNMGTAFAAAGSAFTQYVAGSADPNGYRLVTSPVPSQAYATAQVINGSVVSATVTDGGSGYGSSPLVSVVGGGGSNATAIATVNNGAVAWITITSLGSGYTNVPTIIIAPPPANALWPVVTPVMCLSLGNLAPYDNYQLEFTPVLGWAWSDLGIPFTPSSPTITQYVNVSGDVGFFRVRHVP
jgi:hypothetical protein